MSNISTSAEALGARSAELRALFGESAAGPIPQGRSSGTVLVATGSFAARPVNMVARSLFWRGKVFNPERADLQNLLSPLQTPAIRAAVYEGPSRSDGGPCIVLDYAKTSAVARWIRDEIREVSPGKYIGLVYVRNRQVPLHFWLDFEQSDGIHLSTPAPRGFSLTEQPVGWASTAPIQITRELLLPVEPTHVFDLLANHQGWTSWFKGMRRVRIDGLASGEGAERTVWVGASRVRERFISWEPGERLVFNIFESSLPGLRSMQEDWVLHRTNQGTRLVITLGVEVIESLKILSGIFKFAVEQSTKGQSGLVGAFS